ncbi:MAG: MlaD family protein [Bacteroidia bacterium]|nr:MlaD family protein [Bacteroidia bacterium]
MKISNEIKFGIFAIITIAGIIYGLNFMSGTQFLGPPLVLYARYPDVNGLARSSPILINGLRVGKVRELKLDIKQGMATVRLDFDEKLEIPDNSVAMIVSVDLLGTKGVKIWVPDTVKASNSYLRSGAEIRGTMDAGIFDEAESLVKTEGAQILLQVAQLSVELNEIVRQIKKQLADEGNQSLMKSTLENVRYTTDNLTSITREVDSLARVITQVAENAESIVRNVEGNNGNINTIIGNVKNTTDSLVTASTEIKRLMTDASTAVGRVEGMVAKLDTTGGTLGLLLNDRQLYDSLTHTTERVNALLREVEANPQRFFDDIKVYLQLRRPQAIKPEALKPEE